MLLTGTSAGTVGGLASIPGIRSSDAPPLLVASSRGTVHLVWRRGFDNLEQGIWTATRTYGRRGPVMSARTRRTKSAYDVLDGWSGDARGSTYLLVRRNFHGQP